MHFKLSLKKKKTLPRFWLSDQLFLKKEKKDFWTFFFLKHPSEIFWSGADEDEPLAAANAISLEINESGYCLINT